MAEVTYYRFKDNQPVKDAKCLQTVYEMRGSNWSCKHARRLLRPETELKEIKRSLDTNTTSK